MFSIIVPFLTMILISCEKVNPTPFPGNITTPAELTAALMNIYDAEDAPGFAVSIIKNDVLLYQESFGRADIEDNKPYTNQTTQPIGSISKTFVAAAIVKAIEQGHFTLETDINDILPMSVKNPKQPNAIIRIKHIVTHTSGLLDNNEAYIQAYHILPGEDLLTEGAQLMVNGFGIQQRDRKPLDEFLAEYYLDGGAFYSLDNFASTAPGSTWNYSNIATSLAAYIVEVATGMPFKEYVTKYIFQPLGMTQTAYDNNHLNPGDIAKLYWDEHTSLPIYANDSYPDGSINTCNEDLAKYLMDMMKGVRGESSTLFSTAGYNSLFEALLPDGLMPSEIGENQGIFWSLEEEDVKHDGSDPGTTCNLIFNRNGHAGYLLLTNMDASTDDHTTAYFELAEKIHNASVAFLQSN